MAIHAPIFPAAAEAPMIEIPACGNHWQVQLVANDAARDFFALLPRTLELEDFGGTEKIAYLPRKLHHDDAPDGVTPAAGDLAYYAPWGNIAIFRRIFRYSTGLVRSGRIGGALEALGADGRLTVSLRALSAGSAQ